MIRLLQIEWLKVKRHRPFWILVGLYSLCITLICCGGKAFLKFLENKGAEFNGISPYMIPLYDYPDVWQNITFVAGVFKVFLGFIIIISIANESTYRTIRQNIIDGLSKKEFFLSKVMLSLALALASTLLLAVIGILMASIYSSVQGFSYMFDSMNFLLAHFLGVFTFLLFALALVLLIPKAGLVIVGLFMYTIVFEPAFTLFIAEAPHHWEWLRPLAPYFPITSINNLVHFPFLRYGFMEIQDYVSAYEVGIVLVWLLITAGLGFIILRRKDW